MSEILPAPVPFYERDQFEIVKSMLVGTGAALDFTYDQWLSALDATEKEARRRGGIPTRVTIIATEAKAWIDGEEMEFTRESLAKYAAHKFLEKIGRNRRMN